MLIRPMRPHDIPQLAEMLGTMEPWTYYGIDPDAWGRSLRSIAAEEVAYVGVEGERVVAFVQFRLGGTFALSGYIRIIAVRPGLAGKGLGRQILSFAEEMILSRGPNVFLLCSARNNSAQDFYRAVGYVECGRLPSYVLADEDEIIFRKSNGPIRR